MAARVALPHITLGDRVVGDGHEPYVIAELSANHGGSIEIAEELVCLAAAAGADAVKLQTFTPESMTLDLHEPPFVVGSDTLWTGRSLYDLYTEAQTPWEWHEPLFDLARSLGIDFLSTPFDRQAVDFLERFEPSTHKVASFELVDLDLIRYVASTGRPLLMSTGMATEQEIDEAVTAAREAGAGGVLLLRCNSAYPAEPGEMDLRTIPSMAERWHVPIGLSDHSPGPMAATVAAGLGACLFEKHLIRRRSDGGPDAAFSIEPDELGELVTAVRGAATVRGEVRFGPSSSERASVGFRRSLYVVTDLAAGDELTAENVRSIRPAGGLPPKHLARVLGRRASRAISRGTPLTEDLLS